MNELSIAMIVTRFTFVLPLKEMPSGKLFDYVVPCDPAVAAGFSIMEWSVDNMKWIISEDVGPFDNINDAVSAAEARDRVLAEQYGVAR